MVKIRRNMSRIDFLSFWTRMVTDQLQPERYKAAEDTRYSCRECLQGGTMVHLLWKFNPPVIYHRKDFKPGIACFLKPSANEPPPTIWYFVDGTYDMCPMLLLLLLLLLFTWYDSCPCIPSSPEARDVPARSLRHWRCKRWRKGRTPRRWRRTFRCPTKGPFRSEQPRHRTGPCCQRSKRFVGELK